MEFCRKFNLQTTGGKSELTNRIAHYMDTGGKVYNSKQVKKSPLMENIIENSFIFSEKYRKFYKDQIGKGFFLM